MYEPVTVRGAESYGWLARHEEGRVYEGEGQPRLEAGPPLRKPS